MARFPIKFAELHNPLFMNGLLGTKLTPTSRTGLKLQYDTALSALLVEYQGNACMVFSSNIASATLTNVGDIGLDSPGKTVTEAPSLQSRAIVQPTAPAPRPIPMAPSLPVPQPRTAQVSHPVHDQVANGPKPTSAPKYLPHTQMQIQSAARIANSGEVRPGAPAPTHADLVAAGKLPAPPVEAAATKAPRARKPAAPKVAAE